MSRKPQPPLTSSSADVSVVGNTGAQSSTGAPLGTSSAVVTAGDTTTPKGNPATITATESQHGQQGTAAVSVINVKPGTYTTNFTMTGTEGDSSCTWDDNIQVGLIIVVPSQGAPTMSVTFYNTFQSNGGCGGDGYDSGAGSGTVTLINGDLLSGLVIAADAICGSCWQFAVNDAVISDKQIAGEMTFSNNSLVLPTPAGYFYDVNGQFTAVLQQSAVSNRGK